MNSAMKFKVKCFVLFSLIGANVPTHQSIWASAQESTTAQQPDHTSSEASQGAAPTAAAPAPPPNGASAAAATATTAASSSFLDKLNPSGSIDVYYGYNFNDPDSRTNQLRNFDVNSNQFSLNLAKFSLEYLPDPLGFRVDFMFGDAAKIVNSSEPGGSLYQYLEQAYASYKAPVGKGLTIDFGKFVTQNGAEVIESKDNWNYSRSLLFSYAIPYYHFGARARYSFSDQLSLTATVTT